MMARISGVDIPREKRLEIALTYIYGIGKPTAQKICADTGLDPNTRVRDLTDDEVNKIRVWIEETGQVVEGDLRRNVASRTSSARSRSAATRASATARACPCTVSAPTPTPAPARARGRPLPTRRRL